MPMNHPFYKSIQWNAINNQGEPVSAGVYLYKIQAGDFVDTKKMILLQVTILFAHLLNPNIKSKQSPLTQLAFLNLIRITGWWLVSMYK